jgi:hypothetical protein
MNNDNLMFWLAFMFGIQAAIIYSLRLIVLMQRRIMKKLDNKRK